MECVSLLDTLSPPGAYLGFVRVPTEPGPGLASAWKDSTLRLLPWDKAGTGLAPESAPLCQGVFLLENVLLFVLWLEQ